MSRAWQEGNLEEVLETMENGSRPKGGVAQIDEGVPSIGGEHLNREGGFCFDNLRLVPRSFFSAMKKGVIRSDDILIVKDGATTGKVAFVSSSFPYAEAAINEHVFLLRPKRTKLSPRFLFFYLFSPPGQQKILSSFQGAAIGGIPRGFARSMKVPVPPLSEQERLVKLLDEADKLRKLRAQADRRTSDLIPALFHDMFGDPPINPRRLPVMRLHELLEIPPNYGTMVPARADNGEWLSLRVANIQDGGLDLTNQKFVNLPDGELERHTVKDGDLLLARAIGSREHLGKCIVVNNPDKQKWAFDSHLMRIRLNRKRCKPEWLKALFESKGGRQLFLNNTRQSAVQFNINAKEFGSILVPLPPLEEQEDFLVRVTEIRELEAEQAASRKRLDALFQSMLHRAFRGEL